MLWPVGVLSSRYDGSTPQLVQKFYEDKILLTLRQYKNTNSTTRTPCAPACLYTALIHATVPLPLRSSLLNFYAFPPLTPIPTPTSSQPKLSTIQLLIPFRQHQTHTLSPIFLLPLVLTPTLSPQLHQLPLRSKK